MAKHNKLSRADQILRAAKMRAAVTGLLNQEPFRAYSSLDIEKALSSEMVEVGYNEINMVNLIGNMAREGLIQGERKGVRNLYYSKKMPKGLPSAPWISSEPVTVVLKPGLDHLMQEIPAAALAARRTKKTELEAPKGKDIELVFGNICITAGVNPESGNVRLVFGETK